MRVLFDYTMFGIQRYGGVSRYFAELIPRLTGMDDLKVSLMMGLHVNRYGLEKQRKQFERFAAIRRPFIRGTHDFAQKINAWWFKRFATDLKFDIYHTTYYFEGDPRAGCRKRIITAHDMIHDRAPGFERVSKEDRQGIHNAMRRADGVVCISQHTKKDVVDIVGIDESKLAVIYHGSPARITPTPGRAVERPYILYVGIRPEYKNFDRLMQAFSNSDISKDHELVLFGGQPLREPEIEMARSLGIFDRLRRIPGGSDALLANLYTHASALAYPSLYEGFGMPILEAFTYDCPVICSDASCLPEIGGDAVLYFDPMNVSAMSEALMRGVRDIELRKRLIAAGHARLPLFSWDKSAAEHAAFYRKIADK